MNGLGTPSFRPSADDEVGRSALIARIWRGWTSHEDADEYVDYLQATGMKAYRTSPGNRGAYILRRPEHDRTEFVTLSFWESLEAVRAFAGEEIEQAVFYPEDDRYLVERERTVSHYELIEAAEN
jgi:heme-degrading monooxygenase HmoA